MKTLDNLIMTPEQARESVRLTFERQARCRVERRLAESLAAATNLANGTALVMWLGNGDEANNLEALVTWVGMMLKQLGLTANRRAIPLLLAELERTLWAWEDQAWQ